MARAAGSGRPSDKRRSPADRAGGRLADVSELCQARPERPRRHRPRPSSSPRRQPHHRRRAHVLPHARRAQPGREANHIAAGRWTRITGNEVCGKTLAIVGFGRIGKEVAIRANAFGLSVIGLRQLLGRGFARWYNIKRVEKLDDVLRRPTSSPCTRSSLRDEDLINAKNFPLIKKGAVMVNTGRGELSNSPRWSRRSSQSSSSPTPPTCSTGAAAGNHPPARSAQRHSSPSHRLPHP